MAGLQVSCEATVWRHDGPQAWYFLSLPSDIADEIGDRVVDHRAGFGSVRVEVTIGATTWRTSLFPDTKAGTYVLPVKKAVRAAEDLVDGSPVTVHLTVLEA